MQAGAAILVVDGTVCADGLAATVRREDVRGWEIDRVRVEECFRVGDVVRAVVVCGLASSSLRGLDAVRFFCSH